MKKPTSSASIFGISHEKAKALIQTLTPRELEVAELIASGEKSDESARRLGMNHKTLGVHRLHIKAKWSARTSADIARIFFAAKAAE